MTYGLICITLKTSPRSKNLRVLRLAMSADTVGFTERVLRDDRRELTGLCPAQKFSRVLALLQILSSDSFPGSKVDFIPPDAPVRSVPRCFRCAVALDRDDLAETLTTLVGRDVNEHGVTIAVTCPSCKPALAVFDPHPFEKELSYEPTH